MITVHCSEHFSSFPRNFGEWELFKLVLSAMREDEESCPARQAVSQQLHLEPEIEVEASMAGLLSTLNEGRIFRICFFRKAQSPTT